MRIVSNGVQPYIVQTGVDTDGETQEEVTTFRMKLDVSEWTGFSPSGQSVALSMCDRSSGRRWLERIWSPRLPQALSKQHTQGLTQIKSLLSQSHNQEKLCWPKALYLEQGHTFFFLE
ncbi:hypothetical protein DPX16_3223 [Anabarilius grahami]|uniref:Uncharacterized protein n=1 Tax=Anabarilius grahami TaxID=495550 RepID=A0A3N0Z073_ANAGA|nr:hypothetical protein DPX16_3223 [Anabarilius grahami]